MALVQVREVVRRGLVQKVGRLASSQNPSGPSTSLWKNESFSRQRRALRVDGMAEYTPATCWSRFSTTRVVTPSASADLHTSAAAHKAAEESSSSSATVTSAGTEPGETDEGALDRNYGEQQKDQHKVAEGTAEEHSKIAENEKEPEGLKETGFDISNASRPSGGG